MNLDFTWESYGDAYRVFDGSGGVHVSGWYETRLIREVERLTRERDEARAQAEALARALRLALRGLPITNTDELLAAFPTPPEEANNAR